MLEMILKVRAFASFYDKIFYCTFPEYVIKMYLLKKGHQYIYLALIHRLTSTNEKQHVSYYKLKQIIKINHLILLKG
jgi:hypothetical protein